MEACVFALLVGGLVEWVEGCRCDINKCQDDRLGWMLGCAFATLVCMSYIVGKGVGASDRISLCRFGISVEFDCRNMSILVIRSTFAFPFLLPSRMCILLAAL